MLDIRYDKAIQQKQTKLSLFISFDYDEYTVSQIKTLPTRYYNPDTQEWEIPTNLLDEVKQLGIPYKITEKNN